MLHNNLLWVAIMLTATPEYDQALVIRVLCFIAWALIDGVQDERLRKRIERLENRQ